MCRDNQGNLCSYKGPTMPPQIQQQGNPPWLQCNAKAKGKGPYILQLIYLWRQFRAGNKKETTEYLHHVCINLMFGCIPLLMRSQAGTRDGYTLGVTSSGKLVQLQTVQTELAYSLELAKAILACEMIKNYACAAQGMDCSDPCARVGTALVRQKIARYQCSRSVTFCRSGNTFN